MTVFNDVMPLCRGIHQITRDNNYFLKLADHFECVKSKIWYGTNE